MLIIVGVLLTLLTPVVVLGLGYLRVRRRYQLLVILITTLIALVFVSINIGKLPFSVQLTNISPAAIFLGSLTLLVDYISWSFVIAILVLILVTFLMDIAHLVNLSPYSWAFVQFFGGLGIVAVLSGNPLTILITWSMIDITECMALLRIAPSSRDRENVVISLTVRITGIVLVISALIIAQGMGILLSFDEIPNQVSVLLIIAAGLRLGVLPLNQLKLIEPNRFRNIEVAMRLFSSAAGIVLAVRAANFGVVDDLLLFVIVLSTAIVILNAIFWIQAKNNIIGLSYWILGYGSFSLVAAAQGLQSASLAWAMSMLLSGALLFYFSKSNRWLFLLIYLGGIGFSALPLTPTWEGSYQIYSLPWFIRIIFIIIQTLMFVGYIRITMQSTDKEQDFVNWTLLIYSIGLVILPITHFSLFYAMWISGLHEVSFQTPGWWSGVISIGLAAILFIKFRDKLISPHLFVKKINTFLLWVSGSFWWGYRFVGRIFYFITRLLEGDGSVLWAILILILLTVTISIWGNGEIFEL